LWGDDRLKYAIIADDLTGANDTGVKFASKGLRTAILLQADICGTVEYDVIVIDTDSRSVSPEKAYDLTKTGIDLLRLVGCNFYYKKIDSTMRGNVGSEFDAIYDELSPRFIFFTPAYPANNRFVRDGCLYLGDQLLHETEFAFDPKTPIREAYIPDIIETQSKRKVGVLSVSEYGEDPNRLLAKLDSFYAEGITYILFNVTTEQDIKEIVGWGKKLPFSIVWAGSAALADVLAPESAKRDRFVIDKSDLPVLTVVGSVNPKSRKQLEVLMARPNISAIRMNSIDAGTAPSVLDKECVRILSDAGEAIRQKHDIVLYSSGVHEDVERARFSGARYGLGELQVSNRIAEALGMVAAELIRMYGIDRLILTGGDTARQVCNHTGIQRFEVIGEMETGIPFGTMIDTGDREFYVITKAGGFGTEQTLIRSLKFLKGNDIVCGQL
jgi:uncharacterized protein YgbK (DUF1537 family)